MILSASRRTDIPAFYSDWLMNRLREGYVCVRNPINPRQISSLALKPELVDCIVFWSKNPAPMFRYLDEISRIGYPYYFQFTLTPYDGKIERFLPEKKVLIRAFQELSLKIGKDRVIWRYDPIILNEHFTPEWHFDAFKSMCRELKGYTSECTISFVDRYAKTRRNAGNLILIEASQEDIEKVAGGLSVIAKESGIVLYACSEAMDLESCGIRRASCIDKTKIERILNCKIRAVKDRNQRAACGCMESVDIGAYNTCLNGCLYCYANFSDSAVRRNVRLHESGSPLLTGHINEGENVKERKTESIKINQISLF